MIRRTFVVVAALATLVSPPPARASTTTFVVSAAALHYLPGDADSTYATPLQVTQGSQLLFAPADVLGNHSVTAEQTDANGTPIFDSGGIIGAGQTAQVVGVDALPPGTYRFYCYAHFEMHGVLQIVAAQ